MRESKHVSTGVDHTSLLCQDKGAVNHKDHFVPARFYSWPRIPKSIIPMVLWALKMYLGPAAVLLSLAIFIITSWYADYTSSSWTTNLTLFNFSGISSHSYLYPQGLA